MKRYNIYCTFEQTKKALELGAPIKYVSIGNIKKYHEPTAEQMIGWLEDQKLKINIAHVDMVEDCLSFHIYEGKDRDLAVKKGYNYSSRKEATLAAIDAALEYLSAHK